MKSVFHLNTDDVDKKSELLGNLKNLKEDGSVETDGIIAVLNGDAVHMLEKGSGAEEFVTQHLNDGIVFRACSNSLENREISEEDLIEGVEVVPSAVGEIVKRQQEGATYIKL